MVTSKKKKQENKHITKLTLSWGKKTSKLKDKLRVASSSSEEKQRKADPWEKDSSWAWGWGRSYEPNAQDVGSTE